MKKFQRRKLGKNTPKAVCRFKRDSLPSGPLIRSSTHQPQTDVKTKPSNHVDWQNSRRRSWVFCLKRNSLPRGTLIRSNIYQPQTDLRLYFLQTLRTGKTAREDREWRSHWEGQTVMQSHLWPWKECSVVANDEYNQSSQECSAGLAYEIWPLMSQSLSMAMYL